MKRLTIAALAVAGVAFMPAAAVADGPQAIGVAANHAGLASMAGNIDMVHTHLHHVLNCLVGAGGQGFDQAKGNPCGGSGPAIPQTADAATKTKLEMVAANVRAGTTNPDIEASKKVASDAAAALK